MNISGKIPQLPIPIDPARIALGIVQGDMLGTALASVGAIAPPLAIFGGIFTLVRMLVPKSTLDFHYAARKHTGRTLLFSGIPHLEFLQFDYKTGEPHLQNGQLVFFYEPQIHFRLCRVRLGKRALDQLREISLLTNLEKRILVPPDLPAPARARLSHERSNYPTVDQRGRTEWSKWISLARNSSEDSFWRTGNLKLMPANRIDSQYVPDYIPWEGRMAQTPGGPIRDVKSWMPTIDLQMEPPASSAVMGDLKKQMSAQQLWKGTVAHEGNLTPGINGYEVIVGNIWREMLGTPRLVAMVRLPKRIAPGQDGLPLQFLADHRVYTDNFVPGYYRRDNRSPWAYHPAEEAQQVGALVDAWKLAREPGEQARLQAARQAKFQAAINEAVQVGANDAAAHWKTNQAVETLASAGIGAQAPAALVTRMREASGRSAADSVVHEAYQRGWAAVVSHVRSEMAKQAGAAQAEQTAATNRTVAASMISSDGLTAAARQAEQTAATNRTVAASMISSAVGGQAGGILESILGILPGASTTKTAAANNLQATIDASPDLKARQDIVRAEKLPITLVDIIDLGTQTFSEAIVTARAGTYRPITPSHVTADGISPATTWVIAASVLGAGYLGYRYFLRTDNQ